MISDDLEALALADAAGALDPDEQQALQALVAALPPAERDQVARLYDVAESLGAAAGDVAPSPQTRGALMARIAGPSRYTLAAREGDWIDPGLPGLRVKILALDRERDLVTMLLTAEPGARYPAHRHSSPEECYVLRGSIVIDERVLYAGDFHHADADSDHGEITSTEGADVLLIGSAADYLG